MTASYDKMLPLAHPYIQNFLANRGELRGLGDSVRVAVENPRGDIFDREYLATLGKINDEIFLLPGVDRAWMKSIFTPVVRWTEVTEEGFVGGPVLPNTFNGSPRPIEELRINIGRAGVVGSLVSNDFRSSMIVVPLVAADAQGRAVDYHALSAALEKIRAKYEMPGADGAPTVDPDRRLRQARRRPDRRHGQGHVLLRGGGSHRDCDHLPVHPLRAQHGAGRRLLADGGGVATRHRAMLGRGIDPFSILVPFLVFAIGVSHGAQKMNGIMLDIGRGTDKWVAARYTYRRLFLAGMTALLADAVGFGVLTVIDIPVIRELALTASLGVAV